jgi:hypothetical protein
VSEPGLPGDGVLPAADPVLDRHVDLPGPVDAVWPWVEQLGKSRGGWYLPRSVERLVPPSRRAVRRVEPAFRLAVGHVVPDWGPGGSATFEVLELERPHHLVYWSERPRRPRRGVVRPPVRMTWALVLSPAGEHGCHLHARLRLDLGGPAGPVARYGGDAVDRLTVALMGRGLAERLRETGSAAY